MTDIKIGKLYLVKEYFWFLLPTKEMAMEVGVLSSLTATRAKWLSKHFKCKVSVIEPNTCVVLLEADEGYYKLLGCNGNIGWIRIDHINHMFFDIIH